MNARRRALGRGLDELLGDEGGGEGLREVALALLRPGGEQPRRNFDENELRSLADSIREHGVLQPLVARPLPGGKWEILAGERRWRAAQLAGVATVPVLPRTVTRQQAAALALVENLQRADLNPMEQARGIARLIETGALTHAQAAAAVGMSRAAVSNILRILDLSAGARALLESGDLEMGSARALLPLPAAMQEEAARTIVREGFSARAAEAMVRKILGKGKKRRGKKAGEGKDADTILLERELSSSLSARVEIRHRSSGGGALTVHYGSLETLDILINRLRPPPKEK